MIATRNENEARGSAKGCGGSRVQGRVAWSVRRSVDREQLDLEL